MAQCSTCKSQRAVSGSAEEKNRSTHGAALEKRSGQSHSLFHGVKQHFSPGQAFTDYAEMKRVRTEQIQYAVTQYLKRRQYIDTDGSLKGAKLSQTAEEMAASLTVQTESSCANVVSAAPCQADPQQYENQFSRLRSFLQE
ncbi:TAF5-like RNA polymerase II p300/CBP-associated factor-associated factor 65 kDa subunit 5L [Danio aesculapii]|uniref:TAF5-like RNA polymerase II p300/CBP-associated factor-associated factor 65 kDa subunit 5L n=1 Tax=Danio aesculapii TaxID=1142201 RepID=UPI0024BF164B|nr:TAF5-like RNA polymerase II p300/CBP-associated factor-associated factor 65 kDa subunit 5L [Danio aesculapii]